MIFYATQKISDRLKEDGITHDIVENEDISYVRFLCDGQTMKSIKVNIISTDDSDGIVFDVFDLLTVPDEKRAEVLEVMNELNRGLNIKVAIDDNKSIYVVGDFKYSKGYDCVDILYDWMDPIVEAIETQIYPKLKECIES